ncbi:hypothetical protein D3C76_1287480 [compost metagenome]
MNAIGGPRQDTGKLLGFDAVDPSAQSHYTLATFHLDRGLLRDPAPCQARAHNGRKRGILKPLRVGTQLQWALDQLGIDLQLVIDLLDTAGGQRQVFSQLALHLALDLARQASARAFYIDFNTKGIEQAVQRQGGLQPSLQTRVLDRIGQGRRDNRHQTGRENGHTRGIAHDCTSFCDKAKDLRNPRAS